MCGEALKSKLLFRRDTHEIRADDFTADVKFDDSEIGRKSRKICKTVRPGLYATPDTDLRDSHIPVAHHE